MDDQEEDYPDPDRLTKESYRATIDQLRVREIRAGGAT